MKTIVLMYGGRSPEHDISRRSAVTILQGLAQNYRPLLVSINQNGRWFLSKEKNPAQAFGDRQELPVGHGQSEHWDEVGLVGRKLRVLDDPDAPDVPFDLIFPILHGPNGEDGRLQGYLEMYDIPFAGCGMYASSLCMDKAVCKDFLGHHGIDQARYTWHRYSKMPSQESDVADVLKIVQSWDAPGVFVKPARMGSSVGITRIEGKAGGFALLKAVQEAMRHDFKIVFEEEVDMIEIEFAALGNGPADIQLAGPGEIEASDEFYSYDAKYMKDDGAELRLQTTLDEETAERCREIARQVYLLCECSGFARIDGFYTKDGRFLVNELNTLPGFTSISMYPVLWKKSGKELGTLIQDIVELGFKTRR